jgi:nitroreductase/dihydropteridine reductase
MSLNEILEKRYACKAFNPKKKISADDFNTIKSILRLCPSSVNTQPWHFIIAKTEEGKKKLSKSTQGYFEFNEKKILNASHVVVFCSKTEMDEIHMTNILEQEDIDGRYSNESLKEARDNTRSYYVDKHRYGLKDLTHWMEKQIYLNAGTLLLGAAYLGIDAVPMEGFDTGVLDEVLGLRKKGLTATLMVALGYHSDEDFNASLPKSRLRDEQIITLI